MPYLHPGQPHRQAALGRPADEYAVISGATLLETHKTEGASTAVFPLEPCVVIPVLGRGC